MGSMNKWLGFCGDDEGAEGISCFDSVPIPSLNLQLPAPAPAPHYSNILQQSNFINTNNHHSQDWNMNTFSCNLEDENRPKLENFLGDHVHHMYQPQPPANTTSTIGLSMITNWLRNNPEEEEEAAPPPATAHTLSLSMTTGTGTGTGTGTVSTSPLPSHNMKLVEAQSSAVVESLPRKSIDTFGQRTSIYRGVTRHRWTGRYEAHLWDNSCRREGQTRKGRQVYLGGYDKEDKAARSYDLAALKYWGTTTTTNFPMSNYEKEIEEMKHMTRQEYVASLRRKSSGFSRGASMYRGVTRHHQHGRWQARIGRVAGNKDLYLGTFSTEEEAAEAYDIAAIKFRGLNAVTNFEINRYDVKSILESSSLPIGGAAKRLKDAEKAEMQALRANESNLNFHASWPTIAFHQPQPPLMQYPYQRLWCKQEHEHDTYNTNTNTNTNTHNFLHNIMTLDSSSSGYGANGSTIQDGNGLFLGNEEAMYGSAGDAAAYQQPRSFYYQTPSNLAAAATLTAASAHWNNIPTAVPSATTPNNNINGASTFTVWNDACN